MASNLETFRRGFNAFKQKAQTKLEGTLIYIMQQLLIDAITEWQNGGSNLTGNTRASFVTALYKNGRRLKAIKAEDLGVASPETGEAHVGKYGFRDVDSGEFIGDVKDPKVRQYSRPGLSFQPANYYTKGGQEANEFVKAFDITEKEGYTIVVACTVPYAEYLANKVGYSILMESYGYSHARMEMELHNAEV